MRAIKSAEEEIARLLTGKNIWTLQQVKVSHESDVMALLKTGPHLVLSVRQFLPAGAGKNGAKRPVSLLDLSCDDGRRVVAVASIWSRNPEQASDPW